MKLNTWYVAICCGLVLFTACKKKDNNNGKSVQQQMLEAGKWQLSASTATTTYMGADTTIDLYILMAECDKDDFMLFAGNGTATMDESADKCPGDDQIETGSWALLSNNTKLAIADSNPDTMDLEITNIQMKLKIVKPNSGGTPVTYVNTYKNIR